jgi:hypothetical protein
MTSYSDWALEMGIVGMVKIWIRFEAGCSCLILGPPSEILKPMFPAKMRRRLFPRKREWQRHTHQRTPEKTSNHKIKIPGCKDAPNSLPRSTRSPAGGLGQASMSPEKT